MIWGKVTLGTSKNIVYFSYFKSQGKRRFCYTTDIDKALLRGASGLILVVVEEFGEDI